MSNKKTEKEDDDKKFLLDNLKVTYEAWNKADQKVSLFKSHLRETHDPDSVPEIARLEYNMGKQAKAYRETRGYLEKDYSVRFTEDGLPEGEPSKEVDPSKGTSKRTVRKHLHTSSHTVSEDDDTLQLQRDLAEMGFGEQLGKSGIDGIEGPKTRAALAAYAKANGLDEKASRLDIVNHLRAAANECRAGAGVEHAAHEGGKIGEAAAHSADQRKANADFNGSDQEQVKAFQKKLRLAGYENVEINGNINDVHTGNAVTAFRHKHLGVDTNTLSDADKTKVNEALLNKLDDVLDKNAKADPYKANVQTTASEIAGNAAKHATEVKQALKDYGINITVDDKITMADEAKIKEWEGRAKAAGKTNVAVDGVLTNEELAVLKDMAKDCKDGEEVAAPTATPAIARLPQGNHCNFK